jgi:exosortase
MGTLMGVLIFTGVPERFADRDPRAMACGLGLIGLGLSIRLASTQFMRMTPEMYSLLPTLAGVFLLVGGWGVFRWALPVVAFLFFMFPLPGPVENQMLAPMQRGAAVASTFCLETLGIVCQRDGNVIVVDGEAMTVAERCSGLSMLTIFLAMGVAMSMILVDRPLWERIVLVVFTVPIALAVNVIRITVTGICFKLAGDGVYGITREQVDKFFHDAAGFIMMPCALGMLYVVYQVLSHLVIDDGPAVPASIGIGVPRRPSP